MVNRSIRWLRLLAFATVACSQAQPRAPLTIDDLFNSVDIKEAKLSPDGHAAVIMTTRADWKGNRFRDDLWLWRDGQSELLPLAQSGHDSNPAWSPDGKYVAFLSGRALDTAAEENDSKESSGDKEVTRVWIMSASGGAAFPLYEEALKTHSFAWSSGSAAILFSVPQPLSKDAKDSEHKEWKDVARWREEERGDLLLTIRLADVVPQPKAFPIEQDGSGKQAESVAALPKLARVVTRSQYAIGEIAAAPSGGEVAFLTNSISGRLEHPAAYEIYLVDLKQEGEHSSKQLTRNEALERQLRWSKDGKQLYFGVFAASGNLEGSYRDVQGRLYALDVATGAITRLGSQFEGSWTDYACTDDGSLLGLGQLGTEVQLYSIDGPRAPKLDGKPGSYEGLASSEASHAILFRHSAVNEPTELFIATGATHIGAAQPITHLNQLFTSRDLPQMKRYSWKSDDGKAVEGVLLYPPGQFESKHRKMLTLIHGGPADADGNKFGADWYSWALLAASKGWIVFQPNYRGSSGYGDEFMTGISPHLVSRPGKDILAGVDALVRDGVADPEHLAIGGYSYGGYMTNWLITQTTRFRSAVTGAGAVEHASNWGNDDLTFDDAWYLGGTPWQNPSLYQSEAALFQFDKVKTPVHDVIGADDIRVSASQGYLLERALDALQVPHSLLVFPGEGHGLGKDPWHGYIKVREELKWLEKYDEMPSDGRAK